MPTDTSQRQDEDGAETKHATRGAGMAPDRRPEQEHGHEHELTVTIPVDRAVEIVTAPVRQAGRVLSAKGGPMVYAGLGVLAAADLIAWPTAAVAGLGYAVLRRFGPLHKLATSLPGRPAPASGGNGARTAAAGGTAGAGQPPRQGSVTRPKPPVARRAPQSKPGSPRGSAATPARPRAAAATPARSASRSTSGTAGAKTEPRPATRPAPRATGTGR